MTAAFLSAAVAHWVTLAATAAVAGGLALDLVVLRGAARSEDVRARLRAWHVAGTLVLILAAASELLVRAQTMTGGGVAAAAGAVPVVLSRTHFGTVWIARSVLLLLLLGAGARPGRPSRAIAAALAAAVAATTSVTGHAGDRGDLTLGVLVDWTHILAASAWTGGLLGLALALPGHAPAWPPALLRDVARRFSKLAGTCLVVVVASGAYNAWLQLPGVSALWTTGYGRALAAKLAVVLLLVWFGAVNRWAVVARLGPGRSRGGIGARAFRLARLIARGPTRRSPARLAGRFAAYVRLESALALVVFGCTAVLAESTPARHAIHAAHAGSRAADEAPLRATMEALHAGGGVPEGWTFRPPSGDPERGRQVFARLECYACHRVEGEGFPAPTGRGPDLTGMGGHHPAGYLMESIVNPNAVIVEGPGYTGPDGRSIMPDYRDTLSLARLIDLVAYLRSLDGEHRHPPR